MDRSRTQKKSDRAGNRLRITGASLLGMAIGALMVGLGVYHAVGSGSQGSYYIAALGLVFLALVIFGSLRKRH